MNIDTVPGHSSGVIRGAGKPKVILMTQFGYRINRDRQIDYDNSDLRVMRYVSRNEPSFMVCFACGTCTATCSTGLLINFSLRAVIGNIRRGEIQAIKAETEKCMLCGKCQLTCPRGVNTRNIILTVQRAIKEFNL